MRRWCEIRCSIFRACTAAAAIGLVACAAPVPAGSGNGARGSGAGKAETEGEGPSLEFLTPEQVGNRRPDVVSTLELRHEMPPDARSLESVSDVLSDTDPQNLVELDRACEQGVSAASCRIALPMLAGSVAVMEFGARKLLTAGAALYAARFALLLVPGAGQILMLLGIATVAYEAYRAFDGDAWSEWLDAMPAWQRREANEASERIQREAGGATGIPDWLVDVHGEPLIGVEAESEWKPQTFDQWYHDTTPKPGFDSGWREAEPESGPQISHVVLPELIEMIWYGLANLDSTVELCSQGPLKAGSFLLNSFLGMVFWGLTHPVQYVLGELFDPFFWMEVWLGYRAFLNFRGEAGIAEPGKHMTFRRERFHIQEDIYDTGQVGYSTDKETCGREPDKDTPGNAACDLDGKHYEKRPIVCCDKRTQKRHKLEKCAGGKASRVYQMIELQQDICVCGFADVYP